jgi:flagellar hook-length control protein FliK
MLPPAAMPTADPAPAAEMTEPVLLSRHTGAQALQDDATPTAATSDAHALPVPASHPATLAAAQDEGAAAADIPLASGTGAVRKLAAPTVRPRPASATGTVDAAPFTLAPAAKPLPAAMPAPPIAATTIATQPARLAHDVGLAIARQVSADGNALHIRIEPAELGRIDVRMSFDDKGNLRAVVAADSAAALDLLRRDSGDLDRAMADAGVRADSQSFRFESRSDGRGSDGGSPRPTPQRFAAIEPELPPETPDPAQFQPLRWRGRVDILA